ncbi:hypothetical protein HKK52_10905 [Pseudomonas sp. ADAK2]|uniref:DUF6896 domain-containing protein n=1 Tax=unclassified Pseudomonas TaxID=196821 RepID=UPI001463BDB4|nr:MULTISPECIES: hypothetical protein [unclassified Pseudomonas]QJI41403.1 hypothetical protein HKK53_10905 [Pseudomonas sp. ADAK7]QJI47707.1 hypothetical protein HKK52_10905 [Pseudomonas sp. ADAK2]
MSYRNELLEQLIIDFLSKVDKATELFEKKFGTRSILRLWRTKKIERCGTVMDNITYELHGVGCVVHLPEASIDFDYGPDGRIDGFDVWRLYLLACELPHQYEKYTDQQILKYDFEKYIEIGKLEKISPLDGLYVIKGNRFT